MDAAKQKRLRRIYKAQAEMSQGVKTPHLKAEIIDQSGMGLIEDSEGNTLGYGIIFPKKFITPELMGIRNAGYGLVGGAAEEKPKRVERRELTPYQKFVKDNSTKVRAKLEKKGMKGRELNTAVMTELGKMWSKQKK